MLITILRPDGTGKMFEYLALKRPILGIGPVDGDAAAILNDTAAGKMFDYADIEGIRTFIATRLNSFQEKESFSPSSRIDSYSRRGLTKRLVGILEGID